MSSVAVLTQESFAEHRSGLVPQQIKGDGPFPTVLVDRKTRLFPILMRACGLSRGAFQPCACAVGQDPPVLCAPFCTTLV